MREEMGLQKFESAMTREHDFETRLATSKELESLLTTIDKVNSDLSLKFKREHKYVLKAHEEHLYKDVVYDAREGGINLEHSTKIASPLRKQKVARARNLDAFQKEAL
jgi:hypothetical protein